MKKIVLMLSVAGAVSFEAKAQLPVTATHNSVFFETVSLGVNEVSLEASVKVYPNPVASELIVSANEGYNLNNCELLIHDATGKTVMHEKNVTFKEGSVSVNVKSLPSGIYTVTLNPRSGKVAINKKFVISR
jgi:hypothetical protein